MIKIAFFGTPEFAKHFLAALHADEEISVSAVICQPDKPVGRKQELEAPATKVFAEQNNIPVFQPTSLRDVGVGFPDPSIGAETTPLREADLFIVVAYGKIIPQNILDIPKFGTINVHPSLLPKYRGPSPIQSAIANQDSETGVSIMLLDAGMDHGPIFAQAKIKLNQTETPESLRSKVVEIGAPLLISSIKDYINGNLKPEEQDHDKATICKLLKREDGIIDWSNPADKIDAQIRAYTPWPGTSTKWNDKTLKIHQTQISDEKLEAGKVVIKDQKLLIGTGSSALQILELQLEGKQKMNAKTFINGFSNINGVQL